MPFTDNKGVLIHYQVEGNGPPLVLQHGYGNALESWYELGYVDALKDNYQLILIDARGHGASDKPHQTMAYTNECQAADVIAVLRDTGIRRADYWGYSMGGRIGFAIAQYAPDWVSSLIIGGAAADGRSRIGDGIRAAIRRGGLDGLLALFPDASPPYKARLLASDIKALEACRADSLGFAEILPSMTMPCLMYAGSADAIFPLVEETFAEMPNVTFFNLPGLRHSETNVCSELVSRLSSSFWLASIEGRLS